MINQYLLNYLFTNEILNVIDIYHEFTNKELETLHYDFCKYVRKNYDYVYYDFCKRLTIDQFKKEISNLSNEIWKQLGEIEEL